jgi:hypothetical protein
MNTTAQNIYSVNNEEENTMTTDNIEVLKHAQKLQNNAYGFKLNVSVWTAVKKEKDAGEDLAARNNADKEAVDIKKRILAGNPLHKAIISCAAAARNWNHQTSLPWTDDGDRVISNAKILEHKEQVEAQRSEFYQLVDEFIADYPDAINRSAFSLGTMFDRNNYPPVDEVRAKFKFEYVYHPLPDAGDIRIDAANEGMREIIEHTKHVFEQRSQNAMKEAWTRMREKLEHLRDKVTDGEEDSKKKRLHATLLVNIEDTVNILRGLNLTNDPELDKAGDEVMALVRRLDLDDLKKDVDARQDTQRKVDEILAKFDW